VVVLDWVVVLGRFENNMDVAEVVWTLGQPEDNKVVAVEHKILGLVGDSMVVAVEDKILGLVGDSMVVVEVDMNLGLVEDSTVQGLFRHKIVDHIVVVVVVRRIAGHRIAERVVAVAAGTEVGEGYNTMVG